MNPLDRLTPLLERFPPTARVFFSGVLCNRFEGHAESTKGHIHWLKSGAVEVVADGKAVGILSGPGVIFSPRGSPNNIDEILKVSNVDGVLIGGASLKIKDFLAIYGSVAKHVNNN